jgi:hypothetical protein
MNAIITVNPRYDPPTFLMGMPLVDLTKANALADDLGDAELEALRKRAVNGSPELSPSRNSLHP